MQNHNETKGSFKPTRRAILLAPIALALSACSLTVNSYGGAPTATGVDTGGAVTSEQTPVATAIAPGEPTPVATPPSETGRLSHEPISIDEVRLTLQDIPYTDGQGNTHTNTGNFMEFEAIDTGHGPGIVVPKDPHIRERLEWLAMTHPTGDKTGNWQNPGDFTYEATSGDPREFYTLLELWGPGSAEGNREWKTLLLPGQSVSAGEGKQLAGSQWSYPAVLDKNGQPTAEGWTAADALADALFSIVRRAHFTLIAPEVQGWVNGQPATGFLTIQDAVNLGWLKPRVPMTSTTK